MGSRGLSMYDVAPVVAPTSSTEYVVSDVESKPDRALNDMLVSGLNLRAWIFRLVRWSGAPACVRVLAQRKRVTILCYHRPKVDDMRRHLETLRRRYRFIALSDFVEAFRNGDIERLPRKSLVITLDDGHRSNIQLQDVFNRFGVRPTVFLCSDIVGTTRHFWWTKLTDREHIRRIKDLRDEDRLKHLRNVGFDELTEYGEPQALSADEINAAREAFDFQSHTRFHPILPACTTDRAVAEISGSKTALEQRFNLSIYALAYPNGDFTQREARLAREAGYTCALGLGGGYNGADANLFALQRISIPDGADVDELLVKASGVWDWLIRRWPFRLFENKNARPVGFLRTSQ